MTKRRVQGGSRLRRKLRRFEPELREDLRKEFDAIGREMADEVTQRAPKDVGDLAGAATYKVSRDGMGVSVGYSKDQAGFKRLWKKGGFVALFQEFGTSKHAAQPFLRPAWRAKIGNALDRIDAARKRTIERILKST